MSGNRRKRLEKLEQKLSDLIRQEELVNCICLKFLFVRSKVQFLSEMNKPCPVHGLRRVEKIFNVRILPTGTDRTENPDDESLGLDEAVEEYERRLAQVKEAEDEMDYGYE